MWERDKIGSDNKAFSVLIWNHSATCPEAKTGEADTGKRDYRYL
jgi:hypothetical protein